MSRRVPRARVGHDRWLVSYADFITLLFGFFVVLYAFARADQKAEQVSHAIDSAFHAMGTSPDAAGTSSARTGPVHLRRAHPGRIRDGQNMLASFAGQGRPRSPSPRSDSYPLRPNRHAFRLA